MERVLSYPHKSRKSRNDRFDAARLAAGSFIRLRQPTLFTNETLIMADIVFSRIYPESFRDTSEVVSTENERKYYIRHTYLKIHE